MAVSCRCAIGWCAWCRSAGGLDWRTSWRGHAHRPSWSGPAKDSACAQKPIPSMCRIPPPVILGHPRKHTYTAQLRHWKSGRADPMHWGSRDLRLPRVGGEHRQACAAVGCSDASKRYGSGGGRGRRPRCRALSRPAPAGWSASCHAPGGLPLRRTCQECRCLVTDGEACHGLCVSLRDWGE